ncbi:BQ5605_C021g09318 [Microbotryum silenes-dioicae]|uniref:BQ5605_C021g09318 protein n=1 Tax=Microbotryum silenes-dioicae TaxID=796604 RepID=A0A2X0MP45_9BASI|nr:BQ5605_C021g09318 [Microbotryum silenes-dioicae]
MMYVVYNTAAVLPPACLTPCYSSALAASGSSCETTNMTCLCQDFNFQVAAVKCFKEKCSDLTETVNAENLERDPSRRNIVYRGFRYVYGSVGDRISCGNYYRFPNCGFNKYLDYLSGFGSEYIYKENGEKEREKVDILCVQGDI